MSEIPGVCHGPFVAKNDHLINYRARPRGGDRGCTLTVHEPCWHPRQALGGGSSVALMLFRSHGNKSDVGQVFPTHM